MINPSNVIGLPNSSFPSCFWFRPIQYTANENSKSIYNAREGNELKKKNKLLRKQPAMLPVKNSIWTMATVPGVEVTQQQRLLYSELLQKWWKECKKVKDLSSRAASFQSCHCWRFHLHKPVFSSVKWNLYH